MRAHFIASVVCELWKLGLSSPCRSSLQSLCVRALASFSLYSRYCKSKAPDTLAVSRELSQRVRVGSSFSTGLRRYLFSCVCWIPALYNGLEETVCVRVLSAHTLFTLQTVQCLMSQSTLRKRGLVSIRCQTESLLYPNKLWGKLWDFRNILTLDGLNLFFNSLLSCCFSRHFGMY